MEKFGRGPVALRAICFLKTLFITLQVAVNVFKLGIIVAFVAIQVADDGICWRKSI
jgi:hypothetical protein